MSKVPRVWTGTQWDTLAVTSPDLSNYSTTTQMNTAIGANAGLNLISTQTVSGSSGLSFNNCFSSTYDNYKIVVSDATQSASVNGVLLRLRASGTDTTTGYYFTRGYSAGGAFTMSSGSSASSLGYACIVTSTAPGSGITELQSPFLSKHTTAIIQHNGNAGTAVPTYEFEAATYPQTTSFDGFSLVPATGTFTGTIKVYGYRNS